MNPTYNINIRKKDDGSTEGYVYCLFPDKSFGSRVELTAEESLGLSEDDLKTAMYLKVKTDMDEWISKSEVNIQGNFQP